MPRTRAKPPKPPKLLSFDLPPALREELRHAIDFAEQEAEGGLLDSAARRLEACAEALGPRLAALVAGPGAGREVTAEARAMADALLGLQASAEAFHAVSDAETTRARARGEEPPRETKMDAVRRAVVAVERAIERVPPEQEVPDLTRAVEVLRLVVRGQIEPTSREVVGALVGIEDALRHQVLPALGDLRRARARAAASHALEACGARVAVEASIIANDAEECARRT
jgi:hypothetical protein